MSEAYVVGQISVLDSVKWAAYTSQVSETLTPWGAELVFRGKQAAVMAGECAHPDIVVIRFPTLAAAQSWFASDAYQALIALRQQAADVRLISYST